MMFCGSEVHCIGSAPCQVKEDGHVVSRDEEQLPQGAEEPAFVSIPEVVDEEIVDISSLQPPQTPIRPQTPGECGKDDRLRVESSASTGPALDGPHDGANEKFEDDQKAEPLTDEHPGAAEQKRHSCMDEEDQEEALKQVFRSEASKLSAMESPVIQLLIKYGSLFMGAVGVIMTLVAKSEEWGLDESGSSSSASSAGSSRRLSDSSGNHRRLGAGPPQELAMVTYCLSAAGVCAFSAHMFKQPLVLGYLFAGVLVGPVILDIIPSVTDVQDFSSLGLTFLLFMVGLELNFKELLSMGPVVLLTGLCQFPLTVAIHYGIFTALDEIGVDFGPGKSVFYVAMCCGMSSSMIVAKSLSERSDMDSPSGRLTIGILLFQNIWAIVVLVVQPDLENSEPDELLKHLGKAAILIVVALVYGKFIMHHVFSFVTNNVELMLVISLCWCFFIACFAILPFMDLSLELASLVAGVSLASFPYCSEFIGKIKFVRDFFITIFFLGLGLQIPTPKMEQILIALLIVVVVLLVRWIGIFSLVMLFRGGPRLGALATINLSEISEFAMVVCSLGMNFGHVQKDTLTILIWAFAILAIMSANLLPLSYQIYSLMYSVTRKFRRRKSSENIGGENGNHGERNIVLLGFHKIAAMLVYQLWKADSPLLHRMHVVDCNKDVLAKVKAKGVTTSYGDISSAAVLEEGVPGEAKVVLCTIMDQLLRGTSNLQILTVAKKTWPNCKVIALADSPVSADQLYDAGADYVIESSQICADSFSDALKALTGTWFGHDDGTTTSATRTIKRSKGPTDGIRRMRRNSQISF